MSTGKPNKRPSSDFKNISTLRGLSEQDRIDFSWNEPRWFFRVCLYDSSNLCAGCSKPIDSVFKATLDHIVPRSKGGRTRLANLQLMHLKCNSKKGNAMPPKYSYKAFIPRQSLTGTVTKYMRQQLATGNGLVALDSDPKN